MVESKFTFTFSGTKEEIKDAIEEYLYLSEEPKRKPNGLIEWWVYTHPLTLKHDFIEFQKIHDHYLDVNYSSGEIKVSNQLKVKLVMIDNLVGVEFGENDVVYLKDKFTKDSAQQILSRMR